MQVVISLILSKMRKIIFYLTLIVFFSFQVSAVEYRGVGKTTYKGISSKKKINETISQAKDKACRNAFTKYVKSMEESKRLIFTSIENQIYSNLSKYMTCSTVVDESVDKKNKTVSVVMKASIDTARIDIEITKNSKIYQTKSTDKSNIVTIFFTRTVASQTEKDARVYKREDVTKGVDIKEKETSSGISSTTTETNATETGGSVTKQAAKVSYKVDGNDTVKIGAGMLEVLTKKRYEPIDPSFVVDDYDNKLAVIREKLENGETIPTSIRNSMMKAFKQNDINYAVFGYFDVGVPQVDQASGNQAVVVSLNSADVWILGGKFPKRVGTISGVQMKGMGNDQLIAKNNAINLASKTTADRLVNLINSQGRK